MKDEFYQANDGRYLRRDNFMEVAHYLAEVSFYGVAADTERSVERNISQLQQHEKLRRIGPAKGGYWEVIGN